MPKREQIIASVVIPVYKDCDGLRDTLESLKRQSFEQERFEIIVCNDGALETISSVCREYSVIEVKISPNRGSYYARNRGIEKSQGKYIGFVDADIQVSPDWVKKGVQLLKRYDYVSGPVDIDEAKAHTWTERFEVATALNMKYYFDDYHFAPTANLWVKRSLFDENAMFDERLRSSGDSEFGQRIYASGRYKRYFDETLRVLHPPRDYRALVAKTKRVAIGTVDLKRIREPEYTCKKGTQYVRRVLLHPWKFALKRECGAIDKAAFYLIHRWMFTLHNYYQYRYERETIR